MRRKPTIGGLRADLAAANREVEAVMKERNHWKKEAETSRAQGAGMEAIKIVQLARAIQGLGVVIQQVGQILDMASQNEYTNSRLKP